MKQTSTLARYAPRENVKTKWDNQPVTIAPLANTQARQAIILHPATHVGQENTHQIHLLAAKIAHWGNIRTKGALLKPRASNEQLVSMLMLRKVHMIQAKMPVKAVQLVFTKARLPLPPTIAHLVRQACMLSMPLHLARLAPQASTMLKQKQSQLDSATFVELDNLQKMLLLMTAQTAPPDISRAKMNQSITLARYAPRENIKINQDNKAAKIAPLANIQSP